MHFPYSRERRPIGDVAGLRVAHLIESDGPGGAERVVAMCATLQAAGAYDVVVLPANGEGWLARSSKDPESRRIFPTQSPIFAGVCAVVGGGIPPS